MKAQYKVNDNLTIELEAKDQKDLFNRKVNGGKKNSIFEGWNFTKLC